MKERFLVLSQEFPGYLIGFLTKEGKIKYIGDSLILYRNYSYRCLKHNVSTILINNLTIVNKNEVQNNKYDLFLSVAKLIELLKFYKKYEGNSNMSEKDNCNNKDFLILHKNDGKFFTAYNYDAYILHYLFDYKIINNKKAGFPDNALDRVLEKLEENKISYQIIYSDKNPVVKDYKKINSYKKILDSAIEKIKYAKRLDMIIEKLKSVDNDTLEKIVDFLEKI